MTSSKKITVLTPDYRSLVNNIHLIKNVFVTLLPLYAIKNPIRFSEQITCIL